MVIHTDSLFHRDTQFLARDAGLAHNISVFQQSFGTPPPNSGASAAGVGHYSAHWDTGMIIQEQGDQLVVIRQTDHAVLSGFFAREWGNDLFTRPEPNGSFRLAAAEHDNGWSEWELQPKIDLGTFSPYTFMSIPTEEHIALYQRGLERLIKADHYAALLVSMHCASLYDRSRATLPGFSAKYVKSSEANLVNEFVQRLRLQQLRLKVDLRGNDATKDFAEDHSLQPNFQRFEALDRLSLYFCLAPLADSTIDCVPVDDQGSETDWDIRPQSADTVTLSPYPFRRDPLQFSIMARSIPKRHYADDLDLQKTLARAPYFAKNFTLRPGSARVLSRAAGL
jgi:Protein of unknown function (DUF3891)